MTHLYPFAGFCLYFLLSFAVFGQAKNQTYALEHLVNSHVNAYDFSADNRFKLAAYAELKGRFDESSGGFILSFGNLGTLSFYSRNCLLKTYGNRVYYLDSGAGEAPQVQAFNEALADVFERIDLLGNCGAPAGKVDFVNKWLARKNMEPFDKIFTRHLFLKYGRFDPTGHRIEFYTGWLPADDPEATPHPALVRYAGNSPLRLLLDSTNLRGYYIRIGGYVYVEDVKRKIAYASGEEYTYNGSAFKLFIQKMMTRSAQYITDPALPDFPPQAGDTSPVLLASSSQGVSRGMASPVAPTRALPPPPRVKPLYDHESWMPMMLGLLRSNNVSIADPDVIIYFIDQPFFPRLYEMLSPEERRLIDRY